MDLWEHTNKEEIMSVEFNNEVPLSILQKLEDTPEEVKKDLEEFKIQSAMAQAEIFEKLESDKLTVMSALAETYEANLGDN